MSDIRSTIRINEKGWLCQGEKIYNDDEFGRTLFKNLHFTPQRHLHTQDHLENFKVEYFDQPFVVQKVLKPSEPSPLWDIEMPYQHHSKFEISQLRVDPWDRFLGYDINGIPFVLSPTAQDHFFDLMDEFDDDSITVHGQTWPLNPWFQSQSNTNHDGFWNQIYQTETTPGWDLEAPSPVLKDVLPQIKLNKSRIAVLGCGSGQDAAYLAQQGHIVTGFDFSSEAIERAQSAFHHIHNLNFVHADVFTLPPHFFNQFDVVFEHTCYCAIPPEKRDDLVKVWKKLLTENGYLLGVFFAWDHPKGPPYGSTEWEIRERLKRDFQFLYWTRWAHSHTWRQGLELVVYASMVAR